MRLRILVGDCRETLRTLDADSVDCVVTSPPFFGLRDYQAGPLEIGREPSLQEYIASLVAVFREVRRVLRPEGTVWLNLGDAYAGSGKGEGSGKQTTNPGSCIAAHGGTSGLAPKNLMLVPARVAIALQDDGWIIRSEIVWGKIAPMPESVQDRPTCAHERIWLMARSPRYHFNSTACAQPAVDTPPKMRKGQEKQRTANAALAEGCYGDSDPDRRKRKLAGLDAHHARRHKDRAHPNASGMDETGSFGRDRLTRRLRNYEGPVEVDVWEMGTAGFPGAHFACFPKVLVERCLDAGCPPGGTVLDPFGGAGTTGLVALASGRKAVLCELNEEYAELARKRIESGGKMDSDLRRQANAGRKRAELEERGQGGLF